MKATVITPLFALSGVALAQIRFAKALAREGHDVTLVLGQIDKTLQFPELGQVRLIDLECSRVRNLLLPLVSYLRREQPDVVFSAEDHLNCIVLMALLISGSRAKFSGSSRVTPFDTYSHASFKKKVILKSLMKILFFRADALTCVSKDMVHQYQEVFENPPHVCVYNIINDETIRQKLEEPLEHEWLGTSAVPVVVAAGALGEWKGFDILLKAFSILLESLEARLVILGDGPLRRELQTLAGDLGVSKSVRFEGFVYNPVKYFREADVFALSSRVEGMPNVLVEAMIAGCTPVAADCPTGPRELLCDGKYGYLVETENPQAMAQGLAAALKQPIEKELLDEATEQFSEKVIIRRHLELLGLD